MGLIRLRDRDFRLARDERDRDDVLDRKWYDKAEDLLVRWRAEAHEHGIRIRAKTSFFGPRFARMSTTYFKEIRLGTGYGKKSLEWRAVTMGHELFHARQWRRYGRRTFRTRYLFWPRWRWAMEVQAYSESVRILVALGASKQTLDDYIASRPRVLWDNYGLRVLSRRDVYAYTLLVLKEVRSDAESRLAA